jgi:high affinity sulfate transporter 1
MSSTTPAENGRKFALPPLFLGMRGVTRADWPREAVAGITLAALMIPMNIGYAQVAGLPPVVGLYAAIVPIIAYAIFSTSRNVVASPDAAVAALVGSLLMGFAAVGDPARVQFALALALICAVIFFLFWFFRLGFLANFLSRAVLVGFISGLGIEVLISQIEKIMGVSVEAEDFFAGLWELFRSIPAANWYSVAIGVGTILIIRLGKRYAPKVPGALLALVVMTAAVALFGLEARGVSVLGEVPSGLPSLTFPQISLWDYTRLIPGAIAICAITLAEGLLVARQYAQKYDYKLDGDQEMFAYGAANLASALTGSFIVGTSASRTAAMDDAGARSQMPSLVAAVVVAIVLLFFTDALALLPNAALAGIVANAVLSLIEVGEMRELYHMRRSEFWIAMICMLSVLTVGPLAGVAIAFLLSTIDVVGRAARPKTAIMTELPGGGFYGAAGSHKALTAPGLVIYRFGLPLFFANANVFTEQITTLVEGSDPPLEWFVLDAEAVSDIDTTGAGALQQVITLLHDRNITFAFSRVNDPLPDLLERYELLEQIGEEHLYPTNRAAVTAFYAATGKPVPENVATLHQAAGSLMDIDDD